MSARNITRKNKPLLKPNSNKGVTSNYNNNNNIISKSQNKPAPLTRPPKLESNAANPFTTPPAAANIPAPITEPASPIIPAPLTKPINEPMPAFTAPESIPASTAPESIPAPLTAPINESMPAPLTAPGSMPAPLTNPINT